MKILNSLLMRAFTAVVFAALSGLCLGQTSASASLSSKHSTTVQSGAASSLNIGGKVEGGGSPIANATVTLWAAGPRAPQKLAETQTKDDGSFDLSAGRNDDAGVLYLIAMGGVPKAGADKGPN